MEEVDTSINNNLCYYQNLSEFTDRHDFEVRTIIAIMDNCAMVTILNNDSLFIRELK